MANTFCASLSAVAVALTNNVDAGMTDFERGMIQPPLIASLQSVSTETQERIGKYANPIMLCAGIGLWAVRVSQYIPQRRKSAPAQAQAKQPEAKQPEAAPAPIHPASDAEGIAVDLQGRLGERADE